MRSGGLAQFGRKEELRKRHIRPFVGIDRPFRILIYALVSHTFNTECSQNTHHLEEHLMADQEVTISVPAPDLEPEGVCRE